MSRAPDHFRASRASQPQPCWPLLLILAGVIGALAAAAARFALGGL
mgnify:CR=1 FL=1